jgi:epsilon-lactone hydrolase
MSQQQRATVEALLRSAPFDMKASVQARRAGFEKFQAKPFPDGVTATAATLGGRPALELTTGADDGGHVLLYFHGGGYVVGSARTGASTVAPLVVRTGFRAVSVNYRHAPEHPFPAAVEDGLAAYRELLDGGTRPDQVVIAGDSAGGGLTVATMMSARDTGLPQPAAAVLFSPWVDLTLSGESMRTKDGVDPIFTRERIKVLADAYVTEAERAAELASPIFADLRGLAPTLIQVGSNEVLLDDAIRLAARAGSDDVDVTLEIVAGVPHVFQGWTGTGMLDEADAAMDRAARFVTERVRRVTPAR